MSTAFVLPDLEMIIQTYAYAAFIVYIIPVVVGVVHVDIKGCGYQVQRKACLVLPLLTGHEKSCIGIQRAQHIGFSFNESEHFRIPVIVVPAAGAYIGQ